MSTTAKTDRYGDISWRGQFWNGFNGPRNAKGSLHLMEYRIVGANDSKHNHDDVDGIAVTNGTCDGKGWDVILFGEVVAHEQYKTDAQRVASELI